MKLYYSPGACSLASHIALTETGLPFEIESVDLGKKLTKSGADFKRVNPKGQVPCLETQSGENLSEGSAILQYIADRAPEKDLAPRNGTFERYRLQEWLNYVATEVHKGFSPLWNPQIKEEAKAAAITNLSRKFDWLETELQTRPFLMGQQFTVADAYLFTVLSWSKVLKMEMTKWQHLMGYLERVSARPSVKTTLKAEGLL